MAEIVLDIVAEDPEEQHVAGRCIQDPCRKEDVSGVSQCGTAR